MSIGAVFVSIGAVSVSISAIFVSIEAMFVSVGVVFVSIGAIFVSIGAVLVSFEAVFVSIGAAPVSIAVAPVHAGVVLVSTVVAGSRTLVASMDRTPLGGTHHHGNDHPAAEPPVTVRQMFFIGVGVAVAYAVLCAFFWLPGLWAFVLLGPLIALGFFDAYQTEHTILRNFPLLGHARYMLEMVRPEIQQYFIESRLEAYPIEREFRSVVYARSKKELETNPFGSQRDMYASGYEWAEHSIMPAKVLEVPPRITIGEGQCEKPYSASLLNISAMSYGSLSPNAIAALNRGARLGGFSHNTGEGGISPHHLEHGGDLVWQIGTGYFGCRNKGGTFNPDLFQKNATRESVRMIELKISQGAKPGHGGVLPGSKVTQEIADIRGLEPGKTVLSPPGHTAFDSPVGLLEFIAKLRELSGGKPVGFKLCVGRYDEFYAICKAMLATGLRPDFITVDGGEGGTGAAPLEFSNSIGMPAHDAWIFVHNALVGVGLRDKIKIIASGKIMTGFHMLRALALGADLCNSARGMMFALGCIQALRCNTNKCPTGVATTDPRLARGLVVEDKFERVKNFHEGTVQGLLELLAALGLSHPDDLRPHHVNRRIGDTMIANYRDLYDWDEPGVLLTVGGEPAEGPEVGHNGRSAAWARADKDHWAYPMHQRPEAVDPKAGQDTVPKG